MAQSSDGQGTPFRSRTAKLTDIERIAVSGVLAKELTSMAGGDVRPMGAEEQVEKGIDYLARPDLRDESQS